MAKSLLNKLGKSVATGLTALALATGIGVGKARGAIMNWGSYADVVPNAVDYGGQVANYSSSNISFKDSNGNLIQNNPMFSLIYFAYLPTYGGVDVPVGGLNGSGQSASGTFNAAEGFYGLGMEDGQTANYTEGNWDNGYWKIFVDVNGNGSYGTYDSETGFFDFEEGEMVSDVRVSGFDPFHVGQGVLDAGNISGVYEPVPEPSTVSLIGVGVAATLAVSRRRRGKGNSAK